MLSGFEFNYTGTSPLSSHPRALTSHSQLARSSVSLVNLVSFTIVKSVIVAIVLLPKFRLRSFLLLIFILYFPFLTPDLASSSHSLSVLLTTLCD